MSQQNRDIIHGIELTLQMPEWQNELANSIKDPLELVRRLELSEDLLPSIIEGHKRFPLRVTESYLQRMKKGDPDDPLLIQILPTGIEASPFKGYTTDPVSDKQAEKVPGLLQKYNGRVLLTLTGACGVHCRYCFRRHFDYNASNPSKQHWSKVIDFIKSDKNIFEVILSGGDPLSLNDQRLKKLVSQIDDIEHIKFIRIHTRQIIVLPSRVNDQLIEWLSKIRSNPVVVTHINHPNEINEEVSTALAKLKFIGIELFNQSVLLKKVNDDAEILARLSIKLFENGIKPYYLHMLDKTQGTAHFDMDENHAKTILANVRKQIPGYLVPTLVREIASEPYKTPLI